jgi:plastocyanin
MKSTLILSTIIAVCALNTPSLAQDGAKAKTLEELQREVRALEARLQALSVAANEVAELMMRSATIWSRALAGDAKAAAPPPAKNGAKGKPRSPVAPPRPSPLAKTARELGTVRGKVSLPTGEPIAYAYVENVFAPPVRGKTVVIDQKNKTFVPGWAVIRRGTTVEFPNHDNIYHNVSFHMRPATRSTSACTTRALRARLTPSSHPERSTSIATSIRRWPRVSSSCQTICSPRFSRMERS